MDYGKFFKDIAPSSYVHEMSFAEAIISNVLKFAHEKNAKAVTRIKVLIGELLLINPEQLKFCFEVASKGTIVENAELEIEIKKVEARCTNCGKVYYGFKDYLCECGGLLEFKDGKEFILEKIAMEV